MEAEVIQQKKLKINQTKVLHIVERLQETTSNWRSIWTWWIPQLIEGTREKVVVKSSLFHQNTSCHRKNKGIINVLSTEGGSQSPPLPAGPLSGV